jgi:hypothetical protein
MQLKVGGKFHLKLNIGERPIANKYREGKMKSTLERELTVREIVGRETLEVRLAMWIYSLRRPASVSGGGKGFGEGSNSGCVIAPCWIHLWGLRNAARFLQGSRAFRA